MFFLEDMFVVFTSLQSKGVASFRVYLTDDAESKLAYKSALKMEAHNLLEVVTRL